MSTQLQLNEVRLETVQTAAMAVASMPQDRSYLLLEDLLIDPIEWTLCDVNAVSAPTPAKVVPANVH